MIVEMHSHDAAVPDQSASFPAVGQLDKGVGLSLNSKLKNGVECRVVKIDRFGFNEIVVHYPKGCVVDLGKILESFRGSKTLSPEDLQEVIVSMVGYTYNQDPEGNYFVGPYGTDLLGRDALDEGPTVRFNLGGSGNEIDLPGGLRMDVDEFIRILEDGTFAQKSDPTGEIMAYTDPFAGVNGAAGPKVSTKDLIADGASSEGYTNNQDSPNTGRKTLSVLSWTAVVLGSLYVLNKTKQMVRSVSRFVGSLLR